MMEDVFAAARYRCRIIYGGARRGVPVVFLHGYSFTSDVWRDIGVLDALEGEGIPFLAIDMPYGRRSSCSPHTRSVEENLLVLREAVHGLYGPVDPFLVGASLGGYIALHYATRYGASGLLLIAPVNSLEDELAARYRGLRIPAAIILGEKDEIVSRREMEELARLLGAELHIYPGARHAAYLDNPQLFTKHLLETYRRLA